MNIIDKKISVLVVLGLAVFFSLTLVSTVQAGAEELTNASTTLTTTYGGREAYYDVSFLIASSTETKAQIHLVFPSGFTMPGAAGASLSTSSISASLTLAAGEVASQTVSAAGDSLILWIDDGTTAGILASDTLMFRNVGPVKSPHSGVSLQVHVETRTLAGEISDSASATAVTIISAPTELPAQTSKTTVADPSSKITSPAAGASITAGQDYVIKGTASDVGVYDVSKVEVSLDGGSTWVAADLTKVSASNFTWEYTWTNPVSGSYTIKSRATDKAGNAESPSLGVSVTVSAAAPEAAPVPTTVSELQAKIAELQQTLISLLQQLIQLLTQQLQSLTQ